MPLKAVRMFEIERDRLNSELKLSGSKRKLTNVDIIDMFADAAFSNKKLRDSVFNKKNKRR